MICFSSYFKLILSLQCLWWDEVDCYQPWHTLYVQLIPVCIANGINNIYSTINGFSCVRKYSLQCVIVWSLSFSLYIHTPTRTHTQWERTQHLIHIACLLCIFGVTYRKVLFLLVWVFSQFSKAAPNSNVDTLYLYLRY